MLNPFLRSSNYAYFCTAMKKTLAYILLFAALSLVSCKTREKVVEVCVPTKEYITKVSRDSVYVRDSVTTDTVRLDSLKVVYKTRYRVEYRERLRVDTAYKDSLVVKEKEVVREVARMSNGQKVFFWIGIIASVSALVVLTLKLK